MQIIDTYSKLRSSFSVKQAHPVFRAWDYTDSEVAHWFQERVTPNMLETAELYLSQATQVVSQVEEFFKRTLPGELVLIPSMGEIDGFARYDHGHHTVMLGIDFPDATFDYLRALTAHELSHVYRDHCPDVWGFLGKPLTEISRTEYLEATSGLEHLVSEGLATLTSQVIFPEIPLHIHHYYELSEMLWCEKNTDKVNHALGKCLKESDPDPWRFYGSHSVARGSPSRTHYYLAEKKIGEWIKSNPGMTLLEAHALPADQIKAF